MKSSRPASAHCISSNTRTRGPCVGEALEEEPPGGEQVLAVGRRPLRQPEQLGEPRLDQRPLLGVGDVLLDRRPQLRQCRLRRLLLDDPRPHPHHLRQRPVGDAFAVGEAAAAVPPDVVGEPVDVLLELPGEARLADPGDADDRDELGLALLGGRVEQLLDQAQLAVAADERRLEADGLQGAAAARGHTRSARQSGTGSALPFSSCSPAVLVGDRRLGRPPRRLADEHGAGLGRGLDPRGGVDEVAGDHALARGAEGHGRLAGEDAGAGGRSGRRARPERGPRRRGRAPRGPPARRRPRSRPACPRRPSPRRR